MKDSSRMLEWMHDEHTTKFLGKNFQIYTLSNCENFICNSKNSKNDCHLAVVNEDDEYMGTVSLKHMQKGTAEFAIVIHPSAYGRGYGSYAIKSIIAYGFETLKLRKIYWNVMKENKRAIQFYERNGYKQVEYNRIDEIRGGTPSMEEINSFLWYLVEKG